MSGPKTAEYYVTLNREVEERARLQALDRDAELEQRLNDISDEVRAAERKYPTEALNIPVPKLDRVPIESLSTRASAEEYVRKSQDACRESEANLLKAVFVAERAAQCSASPERKLADQQVGAVLSEEEIAQGKKKIAETLAGLIDLHVGGCAGPGDRRTVLH